jgi:alpha-galactosidase
MLHLLLLAPLLLPFAAMAGAARPTLFAETDRRPADLAQSDSRGAPAMKAPASRLPVMGYSNWYDTKCDVHAERFLEVAVALEKTGLKALGYTQINVDAGWALPERDSKTHELVADPRFFPKGMDGLEAELRALGYQLGGYTDRGGQQCGPSPGSKGYESLDAALFMRWNLSYVKSDDCNATLEYAPAMADYKTFAIALQTAAAEQKRSDPYFLICGCKLGLGDPDPRKGWEQCPRDAREFATAWRISSDDYFWGPVLANANINAGLTQFSGSGRFNDPDMLINQPLVPAGWPSDATCPNLAQWKQVRGRGFPPYAIKAKQARVQFSLWSIMAAPLILSMNVRNLSSYDLETYSNAGCIAVNQDPLVLPGIRLQGYNLTAAAVKHPPAPPPPPGKWNAEVFSNYNIVRGQCEACKQSPTGCCINGSTPNLVVQYLSHHGAKTLAACESLCHGFILPPTNKALCHSFMWNSNNNDCFGRLDTAFDTTNPYYKQGPGLFSGTFRAHKVESGSGGTAWESGSPPFGNFSNTNIWGKNLVGGSFSLLFLNVGPSPSVPLSCDTDCIRLLLGDDSPAAGTKYSVRDLWAETDLPAAVAPLHLSSPALETDSVHMVRLTPLKMDDGLTSIVALRNITFSCNTSTWGPAPSYCVDSAMAEYLPLSGAHFGHDVQWDKFPEAVLWKKGDGLVWTDDIPICHHNPSAPEHQVDNISSFIASIRHYKLATTYCTWDVDGKDARGGGAGGDYSTVGIAEWGYDWYATTGPAQHVVCNDFGRGTCAAATRRGAYDCVKAYWDCRVSLLSRARQKNGAMSAMLGHYLLHHMSTMWSALTVIGSEVGENINSIQAHFAFNRGSARQFHLPWFIDFSDWNAGFLHGYTLNVTSGKYSAGFDGHTISLRERVAYMTYMAGASKHKMEDPSLFLSNNKSTAEGLLPLSPVGESAQRTHEFFAAHPDRGKPYVPVAIMINLFHGMGLGWWNIQHRNKSTYNGSRSDWITIPGQPFGPFGMSPALPFTEGDNYTSLLMNTIWPEALPMNLGNNAHDESKRLVGSKYPELWDVLIDVPVDNLGQPDYSYNLYGCSSCGGYRVIMLAGDIDFSASNAAEPSAEGVLGVNEALYHWVNRGGVLVMTAPVLLALGNNFSAAPWHNLNMTFGPRATVAVTGVWEEANRALVKDVPERMVEVYTPASLPPAARGTNTTAVLLSVVTADKRRLPAVTATRIGSGKVVVVHQPKAPDLDVLGVLDWALDDVTDGVTPFTFTGGEVQTLLNRRETGWNITIINNLGVTKLCGINSAVGQQHRPNHCSPDIVDLTKAQTITVTLKPEHATLLGKLSGVGAMEHVTGTALKVVGGNSVTVEVPSGAVRIIGVEHVRPMGGRQE